jgi:altronate hydrolase
MENIDTAGIKQSLEFLRIHPKDNVLVALKDLEKEKLIVFNDMPIILQDNIRAKHKFFIDDLDVGEEVIMYGATDR